MRFFKFDGQVVNTIHLGLAFLLLFSADFTITNLQKLINVSISKDNPDYHVDGYVSMGLTYVFFAVFLLSSPAIISAIGPRVAMVVGASMMTTFFFLFSFENTWLAYIGIFLTGTGGSILWVGEGNYLVLNADPKTVSMHISIFWATFTVSMMSGNIYTTIAFAGKTHIDYETRRNLFYFATAIGVVSVLVLIFLRPPKGHPVLPAIKDSPKDALKRTFRLYFSKEFLTLLSTLTFIGFQQSFGWGIHYAAIGFTSAFGKDAAQLASIAAITYGAGDSIGSAIHIFAPKLGYFWTRRYVFWIGYCIQIAAIVGIFINLPDQSVFGYTHDASYLQTPQPWLAILCSTVLGVSDGFYNTQVYALLAHLCPEHSAQSSALFKFTKSMTVAIFFFASLVLSLRLQLAVIAILGFIGSICFAIVDKQVYRKAAQRSETVT